MKKRLRKKAVYLYYNYFTSGSRTTLFDKYFERIATLSMLRCGFTVRSITSRFYKLKKKARQWKRK